LLKVIIFNVDALLASLEVRVVFCDNFCRNTKVNVNVLLSDCIANCTEKKTKKNANFLRYPASATTHE